MTKKIPSNSTGAFLANLIDRTQYESKAMELYVLGALINYSQEVLSLPIEKIDETMVNPELWRGLAQEVLDRIDKRFPDVK